jgi:tRNA pseudouridine13 synthase
MSSASILERTLPYLTTDLPGVGGVIKRYNEDFIVEELPLYPASGEGTHVYFSIEKQGVTTLEATRVIANALGRQPRDIGYAGMKDAHGITRQWLSLEHVDPTRIESLDLTRIRVLATTRHTNKIKLGHLAGNRFEVKVRDMIDDPLHTARAIVETLTRRGVPNYFGPQRFGVRGDNAAVGLAIVREDYDEAIALILGRPTDFDHGPVRRARELFDAGDIAGSVDLWQRGFRDQARLGRALLREKGNARRAWRAMPHSLRKLFVSALQSELFNRVVARRIGELDRLIEGDIAWKHVNGACFRVEDLAAEQPRCDALEISPTGPLFGRRMTQPTGPAADMEEAVLEQAGLEREQVCAKDGTKLDGARRPLRIPLIEPGVDAGVDDRGPYLLITFALPPGAYATTVLREICKSPSG